MFSVEALHLESFLQWSSVMSSAWETASANSSKEVRLSPVHTDLVMEHWVLRVDPVPGTVDNPAVQALVGQAGHYNNEFLVSSPALACFLVADGVVISKEVSEFQWLVRQQFAFGKNPVSRDRALRQRSMDMLAPTSKPGGLPAGTCPLTGFFFFLIQNCRSSLCSLDINPLLDV